MEGLEAEAEAAEEEEKGAEARRRIAEPKTRGTSIHAPPRKSKISHYALKSWAGLVGTVGLGQRVPDSRGSPRFNGLDPFFGSGFVPAPAG